MTSFSDVVEAWRVADPSAIHPLQKDAQDEYWRSGWFQAEQAAAHIPAGGSVVDFGCGDGRVAIPLAHMGFQVFAVDASTQMLSRLAENVEKDTRDFNRDDLILMESDGTGLALSLRRQVDAVVCRAVLIHHSVADGFKLVESFAQVIKPGGVLVADWPTGRRHERRDWIDVTVWDANERLEAAKTLGLELVSDDGVSVWRRAY